MNLKVVPSDRKSSLDRLVCGMINQWQRKGEKDTSGAVRLKISKESDMSDMRIRPPWLQTLQACPAKMHIKEDASAMAATIIGRPAKIQMVSSLMKVM
ncbi:hypothetical protein Tco_0665165 [Tanacetum coccineum]